MDTEQVITAYVDQMAEDSRRRFERAKRIDALAGPLMWALILSALSLSVYWLGFGSGLAEVFPVQHKLMVTMLYDMPGQSEQIQALLNEQGYVSLWQVHDITGRLISDYGIRIER